jgi:4-hydroxy-3-polyprenylbenzoate decarboxylase
MAYYRDLRELVQALEKRGKLWRIKRPVVRETELLPLYWLQFRGLEEESRRGFVFENVVDVKGKKFEFQVAAGLYAASQEIYAIGLMCEPQEIKDRWIRALQNPIPPVVAANGPVQEEVHEGAELEELGLDEIPFPVEEPGFSGTVRTSANCFITKDPETGARNCGAYSAHYAGRTHFRCGIAPTHHGHVHWQKARQRGNSLPVAVVVGILPTLMFTASASLPYGMDELAVAGGLAGEPMEVVRCKTVDLEVPATAELVIEGEILPDQLSPGGAFGDYPGYLHTGRGPSSPLMKVTCITHRRRPIFTATIVGFPPREESKIAQITGEAILYNFLKNFCNIPGILDVAMHESGGYETFAVIQMKKTHPSQPWQALYSAAGNRSSGLKMLIAVDDDVNPHDMDAVVWALCFSMQPHRDIKVLTGKSPSLDPSGYPPGASREERSYPKPQGASSLLIDATRKWPYPPVGLPKKEFMEKAMKIWEEEGLPQLKLRTPWYGYNLGDWTKEDEEFAQLAVEGRFAEIEAALAKKAVKISSREKD